MGKADRVDYGDYWATQTVGTHGAAADAAPLFVQSGGKWVGVPTAVADGQWVTRWLDKYGRSHPNLVTYLLNSATTATGSATGTTLSGIGVYKEIDLIVRVTTAGGTSPALNLFVDSRLDGTNWTNIAHFDEINGTPSLAVHLSRAQGTSLQILSLDSDAAAGTIRRIGWGDDMRIRRDITGTTPSFSYTVYLNAVS
mgnify:CR=1 FL=1